ncbi:MAG: flagellar biosynthesis protein FlgN [Spirochaetaceae bacterium]|jgi:hypothetical protein|nr:flagellar biosynthesis protein FlgN [Spirochaetaceae bacterium]
MAAEQHENTPDSEYETRVAVLKRFRQLLVEQRDRFNRYLEALDTQKNVIETGDVDDLAVHVELEEKIVADIISIEKCMEPARAIYEIAWTGRDAPEIPELTSALVSLREEAARRVNENKELLKTRMTTLRGEIANLRANPFKRGRRSVFAESAQPSLLDIKG